MTKAPSTKAISDRDVTQQNWLIRLRIYANCVYECAPRKYIHCRKNKSKCFSAHQWITISIGWHAMLCVESPIQFLLNQIDNVNSRNDDEFSSLNHGYSIFMGVLVSKGPTQKMSEFNCISIATSTSNGLHKIELTTMNCRGKIHFIFIRSMAMSWMSPVITWHIYSTPLTVRPNDRDDGRTKYIFMFYFWSNKRIAKQ